MSRLGNPTGTLNELVGCDMPTRDGRRCNKTGDPYLPEGICLDHALAVFRAVRKLIDVASGVRTSSDSVRGGLHLAQTGCRSPTFPRAGGVAPGREHRPDATV